ncbi:MAG: hypothetical protein WDZ77_02685 [Candidatus Pacearchaeota archaeon]
MREIEDFLYPDSPISSMEEYNFTEKIRNGFYTGIASVAIASMAACGGGGGSSGSGENPNPPSNRAPSCEISTSYSPESGYFPLETRVQASCSDPDGDSLDVRLLRNGQEVATGNNQDYSETIVENADYKVEATDPDGASGSANTSVEGRYDQIAFTSRKDDPSGDIYRGDLLVNKEGDYTGLGNITRLTNNEGNDIEPTYSHDGEEIIFTRPNDSSGEYALHSINADTGEDQKDLTSHLSGAERMRQADECSDGRTLGAFQTNGNTEAGIAELNKDRNILTHLYRETNDSPIGRPPEWPSWNSDCSKFAYGKNQNNSWSIFTLNDDGTNEIQLTWDSTRDQQPTFLPDGRVLFFSDRTNPGQTHMEANLWVVNSDGSNPQEITNAEGRETDAEISPDGEWLVFSHSPGGENPRQLYLTKFENAGNQDEWLQLTSEGNNRHPAWRPRQE